MTAPLSSAPVHVTPVGGDRHIVVRDAELHGIFPEVVRGLARGLNFTPAYFKREDRNYGHLLPNGSYSGAIRSVIEVAASLSMYYLGMVLCCPSHSKLT